MDSFEQKLTGGHPNSLGNTVDVVQVVLDDHSRFEELFNCYFSTDEVIRLRVSNAMKRIGKENKRLLVPYVNRFLTEISTIDQASTQWTLAQLFLLLENDMDKEQLQKAKEHLTKNLSAYDDWIVLNMTMETLGKWSKHDDKLKSFLVPHLERMATDERKSVRGKAKKWLEKVG